MFEDLIGPKLPIMMVLGDWNLLEAKKREEPRGFGTQQSQNMQTSVKLEILVKNVNPNTNKTK